MFYAVPENISLTRRRPVVGGNQAMPRRNLQTFHVRVQNYGLPSNVQLDLDMNFDMNL